jgi:hypothetical protein
MHSVQYTSYQGPCLAIEGSAANSDAIVLHKDHMQANRVRYELGDEPVLHISYIIKISIKTTLLNLFAIYHLIPVTLTGISSTGPWTETASSASAPSGTRIVNSAG